MPKTSDPATMPSTMPTLTARRTRKTERGASGSLARSSGNSAASPSVARLSCAERRLTAGAWPGASFRLGRQEGAERGVDAVLPARPGLLEMVKDVAVDAEGNEFLGAGDRGRLRRQRSERLFGRLLERGLGGI